MNKFIMILGFAFLSRKAATIYDYQFFYLFTPRLKGGPLNKSLKEMERIVQNYVDTIIPAGNANRNNNPSDLEPTTNSQNASNISNI